MSGGVQTLEGWFILHDFRSIDWTLWKEATEAERQQALEELGELTKQWTAIEAEKKGSTALYSIVGQKADLSFVNLRPTLQELNHLETEFNKTSFADFTIPSYSYVSVVELSTYIDPNTNPDTDPYIQSRLYPILPKTEHICFYPMNKKRDGNDNWFMLTREERGAMMRDHGLIGRKYAGKVTQVISGSIGYDDWEWGVTLFADDPLQFKKLIYEMRFDEVSARFGEFGTFLVGNILNEEKLTQLLQV